MPVAGRNFMKAEGTKREVGIGEVRTHPRVTDPSKESTKGPPAHIQLHAPASEPSPAGQWEHWGRIWPSYGLWDTGNAENVENQNKTSASEQHVQGTSRKRPQGDPQKDDTNQKNGPTDPWI